MNIDSIPIWVPENAEKTRFYDFMRHVNRKKNLELTCYKELWKWTVEHISEFWDLFLNYSNIKYTGSYEKVIDETIAMQDIPLWFKGVTLNYAENLLHRDRKNIAVISESESGKRVTLTHQELYQHVTELYHKFKRFGLKKGDIVASDLPNDHRPIIAMLACTALGCIWTSMPTELQAKGVEQKLVGIKPRIFLGTDKYKYAGRIHDQIPKLKQLQKDLDYLEAIIIFPSDDNFEISENKFMTINQFSAKYGCESDKENNIVFTQVPFSHPLFILYTSGTTGPSKKLVHSVGGTLIKVVMEHILNGDLTDRDNVFYNTSPGWIMWNWIVTSLYVGGTLLVYDGSPIKPDPFVLWEFCDRNKATVFGSGAAYYGHFETNNICPNSKYKLENLRYVLSTGSYLPASSYYFINKNVKSGIPICSIACASDLISCFAGHNLTLPVYPGEVQYPNLGMYVNSYDESASPIYDKFGELVCIKPFPSMPVYFMNDEENKRYMETYFAKFKGVWTHGDYCLINSKTGGIVISGRSDSTLNVNGVRIGTSEIYTVVQQVCGVEDSLCVCQSLGEGRERMILFVSHTLKEGSFDDLKKNIQEAIRESLSLRHMPSLIIPAPHIPYTITGKKVEILVKKIISKMPYSINHESLKDTSQLDYYINLKL